MLSLSGKSIVITRPPRQADELKSLIEARGGIAVAIPTIEILPPAEWGPCDRAIDSLGAYSGLVFASANGVEAFFQRIISRRDGKSALKSALSRTIFAVGARTAAAIRTHGAVPVTIPEVSTATGLAGRIAASGGAGHRYLFPSGDLSPETIAEAVGRAGGAVDRVVVYRTVRPVIDADTIAELARAASAADCITFTSPSSARIFSEMFGAAELQQIRGHAVVAVIGTTTAEAAALSGFPARVVADEQSAAGLVDAICRHFESASTGGPTPPAGSTGA